MSEAVQKAATMIAKCWRYKCIILPFMRLSRILATHKTIAIIMIIIKFRNFFSFVRSISFRIVSYRFVSFRFILASFRVLVIFQVESKSNLWQQRWLSRWRQWQQQRRRRCRQRWWRCQWYTATMWYKRRWQYHPCVFRVRFFNVFFCCLNFVFKMLKFIENNIERWIFKWKIKEKRRRWSR